MSKKLSGAAYKKRKVERIEEDKRLGAAFAKFLRPELTSVRNNEETEKEPDTVLLQADSSKSFTQDSVNSADSAIDKPNEDIPTVPTDNTTKNSVKSTISIELINGNEPEAPNNTDNDLTLKNSTDNLNINFSDPFTWTNLNLNFNQLKPILIEHGPKQVKTYEFPTDKEKRSFSIVHYYQKLINGERIHRDWLQYSTSSDKVYCFCCLLFSTQNRLPALANNGSKDWHNMTKILGEHQNSPEHKLNYNQWKEYEERLKKGQLLNSKLAQQIKEEEKYWLQILERLIALVKVLGSQNLAFQGSNEKLHTIGNGNFLKFVELLSLFDPIMQEHIRRIKNDEIHVHYLGKNIQNELIQILSNAAKQKIIEYVQKAKYFSIILDCTPDVTHVEQMTFIIRFVHVASLDLNEDSASTSSEEPLVSVREHFLGFIPLEETTGANMSEVVLKFMENLELPIQNLRGQGYDNGSNMAGKNTGVQKRILDINSRAFFVPCGAHSLNLVVNDAVTSCTEATIFFDLVQNIYVFFSASPRRWSFLKKHISSLTVKPLSATRWSSRIDAIMPLRFQIEEIYDALIEISEDTSFTGTSGNFTRVEAQSIATSICKYKFLVALVVWHKILFEINTTSKLLQTINFSIHEAVKNLERTKQFLVECRSDIEFERVLVDANELAETLHVEPIFETERVRRTRRQFNYEGIDEPVSDPKEKFKINFYFEVLDTAINSVAERFTQLGKISATFGFLYDITKLNRSSTQEILNVCLNLERILTGPDDSKDIDAYELCSELKIISQIVSPNLPPLKLMEYICEKGLQNNYPNLFIALRILQTLPVNVASGERSFSKLKLIKTYIRNKMTQERLSGLAMLSIEQQLVSTLPLKDLISTFAQIKARKVKF